MTRQERRAEAAGKGAMNAGRFLFFKKESLAFLMESNGAHVTLYITRKQEVKVTHGWLRVVLLLWPCLRTLNVLPHN